LDLKIAKHFIAAPPTDQQADHIGINVATKQGYGPGGSKGMCRDISRKETEGGAHQGSDSGFESR
jgi:hypothetical protein